MNLARLANKTRPGVGQVIFDYDRAGSIGIKSCSRPGHSNYHPSTGIMQRAGRRAARGLTRPSMEHQAVRVETEVGNSEAGASSTRSIERRERVESISATTMSIEREKVAG